MQRPMVTEPINQWLFKGPQYNIYPFNQPEFQEGLLKLANGINNLNKSNFKFCLISK